MPTLGLWLRIVRGDRNDAKCFYEMSCREWSLFFLCLPCNEKAPYSHCCVPSGS